MYIIHMFLHNWYWLLKTLYSPFDLCVQLAPILCNRQHGWKEHIQCWVPYPNSTETFFGKYTFLSGHLEYQTVSTFWKYMHLSHIIAHYHSNIKKFLPAVTGIWVQTHWHPDEHIRPIYTRFTTDQPHLTYKIGCGRW